MTTFEVHEPFTPAGNPLKVAPDAPVVVYVIFVIGVPMQTVWFVVEPAELRVIVLPGVTVITPFADADPQPPVNVTV